VVALAAMMRLNTADAQLVVGFVIFGVALALVVSLSVAREFSASLSLVEAAARQIADGDYSFRLDAQQVNGGPELASLARSFNRMADGVQQAFSERQRAEDERRQLMAALSHDVRTPVASLRAMIEAIDDGVVSDPETIARYQRTMRHEVRHLTDLLDQLFDLARLEAGTTALRRERVALGDLISDAIEATTPRANERGVRLTGNVAARLPTLELDARQIHRVLSNLLDNALRHTPAGGVIAIRAELAGDHMARVRILDSGEGIAAADLPYVFQAAYRGETSRSRSTGAGAGLGLAIARQIIMAHGGEIHARSPLDDTGRALLAGEAPSQAGPGTEISFTLPSS
jgi:two-component system, OmpR family, sensor histidine kinase SaeS